MVLALALTPAMAQKKISIAFTVKEKDLFPEGIAYDSADQSFYISSIYKHKVVKRTSNGVVSDFITSGQDGVGEVLGMKVDKNRHLWFCSNPPTGTTGNSSVYEYDLVTRKLIQKYEWVAPGEKHELNDLQFLQDAVFVTDSFEGALYKISNGKIEPFIKSEQFQFSNGITMTPDGKNLLVSTARGILQVNPASKETSRLQAPFYIIGVDGLYLYRNSLIAIQNVTFPVSLVQFNLSNDLTIEEAALLAVNHPLFDLPTTGVVVGDWFYFMGNTQLKLLSPTDAKITNPEKLKDLVILKLPLR